MSAPHLQPTPTPFGPRLDRADLREDLLALGAPLRLDLLHALRRPCAEGALADTLGVGAEEIRAHLRALQARGLVRPLAGGEPRWLAVGARLAAVGTSLAEVARPEGGDPEDTVMAGRAGEAGAAPPPVPTASYLLVAAGPDAGTRFALTADRSRWTIGREEDRDFRLGHDPFASGRHAEIQADRFGFLLVDVFSANGTSLNFVRVPRGSRVPLKPGDVVGIGHSVLVFQRE